MLEKQTEMPVALFDPYNTARPYHSSCAIECKWVATLRCRSRRRKRRALGSGISRLPYRYFTEDKEWVRCETHPGLASLLPASHRSSSWQQCSLSFSVVGDCLIAVNVIRCTSYAIVPTFPPLLVLCSQSVQGLL